MKLGGASDKHCIHAKWKGVSGQARVHGGGRRTPLEIKKKDAVGGNFNLFHLCFTNEIRGGGRHHTRKMEGGERAGACPWWGGGVALP